MIQNRNTPLEDPRLSRLVLNGQIYHDLLELRLLGFQLLNMLKPQSPISKKLGSQVMFEEAVDSLTGKSRNLDIRNCPKYSD